jgi:large subunit ribosomal protein L29
MKAAELRQKDVAGVQAEVKELQKAHFGLRSTRRAIARAKTILAEKQAAK